MIPKFPLFKNIEWNDRTDVQAFTSGFQPYSDFNFTSMYSWNTREKMMISELNGNLVVLFYDYLTGEPFLSFIGTNDIPATACRLLEYSERHYQTRGLRLIPEQVALHLPETDFVATPDNDSNDYILSVPYLANFDTLARSSNKAAYFCQKFLRHYPDHSIKVCPLNDSLTHDCTELFKRWAKTNTLNHWELNEYSAFERFIRRKENNNSVVSLYDGQTMIAFASYEVTCPDNALIHFAKADKGYDGVYYALLFYVAKTLNEANVCHLNIEQDMGLEGLRQSKRKYKPEYYLKKYIVERKNG